ncbi:DMT family transporter [Limibaculum sp. FT325]|uniref:DMT family transporter n=1 Tax=Thermohalobaculum sediminis TaxID=2939436 RepID=UPI0020C07CA4|nr:DMT family transporter [Limibaculum sediminis]MCL5775667.1 DMT family transporter [Limibaculum sediminis]
MSATVFLVVIAAAFLHALWNAQVKRGDDKTLAMAAVVLGQGLFALLALAVAPLPAVESWPYIAASVLLHVGYQVFLTRSYRIGDLTQVYPIARGTAPLLVAAVSVGFLGVELGPAEIAGVVVIGAGIMSLSLVRQADGLRNGRAAFLAVTTGCFIAGYSLVDGLGARAAGSPLGFYGVVAVVNSAIFAAMLGFWRPARLRGLLQARRVFVLGGGASFTAYALVVWAFTQAPIALVTALRETSVVFALVIGVVVLRERLDLAKVASTMVTICGAALLRLGKG